MVSTADLARLIAKHGPTATLADVMTAEGRESVRRKLGMSPGSSDDEVSAEIRRRVEALGAPLKQD